MIRTTFSILLLAHGLIHLLGFLKAWKIADIPQLNQPISKPIGALWLLATTFFLIALAFFVLKKDGWWMPGIAAVLLSQALILGSWGDAKFGTVANVLVAIGLATALGQWRFERLVAKERQAFEGPASAETRVLSPEMLAPLPHPVQQWLMRSGAVGKPIPQKGYLEQRGSMRTKPDGPWMPFEARQHFLFDAPGFIWQTEVGATGLLRFVGRDKYANHQGEMLIKLWSLIPVADAKGPETDQGSRLRLLGELCWFPASTLHPQVQWEAVDSSSARLHLDGPGFRVSGRCVFSPEGDMLRFEARRYFNQGGKVSLEDWFVENKAWASFDGIRVASQCHVVWKLAGGDFNWLNLELTHLKATP
jgi:hypothetical protein